MCGQQHVLIGLAASLHLRDHIEHRHFTELLRLRLDAQHRTLTVLRETVHETVVLAAQAHGGNRVGSRVEDLVHSPAVRPLIDHQGAGTSRFELGRERAHGETGRRVSAGIEQARAPRACRFGALLAHPGEGHGVGKLPPVVIGATGGLRHRHQDEPPTRLRQPRVQLGRALERREDDGLCVDRGALRRAWTPGEHHSLQRPHPRLHQIDVRDAAAPSAPGAIRLGAGADAPRAIFRQQPLHTGLLVRGTGETGTDGIEQRLREHRRLRAVHGD